MMKDWIKKSDRGSEAVRLSKHDWDKVKNIMTQYVIICNDTQKYVASFGSERSYTSQLQKAQLFSSKEEAANHACGNEVVIPR